MARQFSPDELAQFNGTDGKPAYIVFQGRVIDVSGSKLWRGGMHMRRHHAGQDLTVEIQEAPHNLDVLDRYLQVGKLIGSELEQKPSAERRIPVVLETMLSRFPFLERHPHPMTVHFPIVFMISAAVFTLLYLATDMLSFETTGWHCLGAAVIFSPVAMATGLFTWWLNYQTKPILPVRIKLFLSPLTWLICLGTFIWRFAEPDIMISHGPWGYVYLIIVISLFPLVSIIGWLGAQLTFPLKKK